MSKNTGNRGRQDWGTPNAFFEWLDQIFGPFTLDVCAEDWSAKCEKYYTIKTDGLIQNWAKDAVGGKFFCNPEFGGIASWLEKGYDQVYSKHGSGLFVLPAVTDVAWFHDWAVLGEIVFLRGRINFCPPPDCVFPVDSKGKPKKNGNNQGTMLVIYEPDSIQKINSLSATDVSATRWTLPREMRKNV